MLVYLANKHSIDEGGIDLLGCTGCTNSDDEAKRQWLAWNITTPRLKEQGFTELRIFTQNQLFLCHTADVCSLGQLAAAQIPKWR